MGEKVYICKRAIYEYDYRHPILNHDGNIKTDLLKKVENLACYKNVADAESYIDAMSYFENTCFKDWIVECKWIDKWHIRIVFHRGDCYMDEGKIEIFYIEEMTVN